MNDVQVPAISIVIGCFNQAPFIADAVAGLLRQNAAGPLEVIVADDGSTDGTATLAAKLLATRTDLIVRVSTEESVGVTRNYLRAIALCRAPLVALLDGDDYWTDPDKLSAQAGVLQANPGCAVCGTNFHILDVETGLMSLRHGTVTGTSFHTGDALVKDNLPGNASACMYVRSILDSVVPRLDGVRAGDWLLNILMAQGGPLAFVHEPMSVYRRGNGGVWTSLTRAGQLDLLLDLLPEYDAVTSGRHQAAFTQAEAGFRRERAALLPDTIA